MQLTEIVREIVNKVLEEQVQLLDVLDSGDVRKVTIMERLALGAIPDVEQAIDSKEDGLGSPSVEQRFLTSTPGGVRSWDKPIPLWGTIQGEMSAQNDLTLEFLKHFQKDEYIDVSEGGADHGKPVVLNAQGKLDPTMVVGVDFNPQGEFTPTIEEEYPTAQDPFEVWRIGGLTDGGYLYTTGTLAGRVARNDDILLYMGEGQWSLLQFTGDTSTFYVLDGSRAITAPFNAGSQKLSFVTDGTEDNDGATVGQVNTVATALDDKYDKTGGDINGEVRVKDNNLLLYRGIYQWVLAHTTSATSTFEIRSGSTPKLTINLSSSVLALQAGRLVYNNKDMASEEFVTDGLGEKADTTDLTSHTENTSNPHDVTKGQVGLDYVDNTSDMNKPVSDATQAELDKLTVGISPIGGIIMYNGLVANIPNNWSLCNGSNGTPDLRDTFVMGTATDGEIGNTGGNNTTSSTAVPASAHSHTGTFSGYALATHNHTTPNHTHPNTTSVSNGGHYHQAGGFLTGGTGTARYTVGHADSSPDTLARTTSDGAHTHTVATPSGGASTSGSKSAGTPAGTVSVSSGGSGDGSHTHTATPPYVKLAYIQRIS